MPEKRPISKRIRKVVRFIRVSASSISGYKVFVYHFYEDNRKQVAKTNDTQPHAHNPENAEANFSLMKNPHTHTHMTSGHIRRTLTIFFFFFQILNIVYNVG